LKNLLHIGSAQKEKIIFGLMDRLGVADSFGGVVMGLEADENCAPIVKELITRYKNALEPALIMLEYYYEEWDSQDPLPERLNRNYL
jgi:hypothetical protein